MVRSKDAMARERLKKIPPSASACGGLGDGGGGFCDGFLGGNRSGCAAVACSFLEDLAVDGVGLRGAGGAK